MAKSKKKVASIQKPKRNRINQSDLYEKLIYLSDRVLSNLARKGISASQIRVALDGVGSIEITNISSRLYTAPVPHDQRIARAKKLLDEGDVYAQGCSDFVCKVLDIPWEKAKLLMDNPTVSIGKPDPKTSKYDTSKLIPGDIVGSVGGGYTDHVAIFMGAELTKPFIDVPGINKIPRALKRWEDDREIFKSSRF